MCVCGGVCVCVCVCEGQKNYQKRVCQRRIPSNAEVKTLLVSALSWATSFKWMSRHIGYWGDLHVGCSGLLHSVQDEIICSNSMKRHSSRLSPSSIDNAFLISFISWFRLQTCCWVAVNSPDYHVTHLLSCNTSSPTSCEHTTCLRAPSLSESLHCSPWSSSWVRPGHWSSSRNSAWEQPPLRHCPSPSDPAHLSGRHQHCSAASGRQTQR